MNYPEWEIIKENYFFKNEMPMINENTPTFMCREYAKTPQDLEGADVVIIGSSYVSSTEDMFWDRKTEEWAAAAKRVRQQSGRYFSGYVAEFDLDVFDHLKVVDYGDVGVVSLDTHWDIEPLDEHTEDPRIAGAANWHRKAL